MAIYARNPVITESYGNEFIDILYELQLDDMTIFEAALNCDFAEIANSRNTALLEAEAEEMNKKSHENFFNKIIKSIKAWYKRICEAVKAAIRKIEETLAESKALLKKYEKARASIGGAAKWEGTLSSVKQYKLLKLNFDEGTAKSLVSYTVKTGLTPAGYMFGLVAGNEFRTCKIGEDFMIKALTTREEKFDVKGTGADNIADGLKEFPKTIKYVREIQDGAKQLMDTVIAHMKEMSKETKMEKLKAEVIMANANNSKQVYTIAGNTQIALIKKNIASYRKALFAITASMNKQVVKPSDAPQIELT